MKLIWIAFATLLFAAPSRSQGVLDLDDRGRYHAALGEMAPIISPCLRRTTSQRVFIRCFDTHSSIHAHWAAYRLALHDPRFGWMAIRSQRVLEPAKLSYEIRAMQYPYAAAWFLRLAIDYEKWVRRYGMAYPHRLRATADQMAAWLDNHYQTNTINPYAREYDNPAWALFNLHSYFCYTGRNASADRVGAQVRAHFLVRIRNASFGSELSSPDFFSVYGNWVYVVAKTQPRATFEQFLALQDPITNADLAVSQRTSIHSFGLVWSRMWAFQVLAEMSPTARDRTRFGRAAREHFDAGMRRHERYQGAFLDYDHWVPQFAVYAITEGL